MKQDDEEHLHAENDKEKQKTASEKKREQRTISKSYFTHFLP
jgi:hypothetical protein